MITVWPIPAAMSEGSGTWAVAKVPVRTRQS